MCRHVKTELWQFFRLALCHSHCFEKQPSVPRNFLYLISYTGYVGGFFVKFHSQNKIHPNKIELASENRQYYLQSYYDIIYNPTILSMCISFGDIIF